MPTKTIQWWSSLVLIKCALQLERLRQRDQGYEFVRRFFLKNSKYYHGWAFELDLEGTGISKCELVSSKH